MYRNHSHRAHGQSMIVLVLIIAFFVVGALALFGFEVHRLTLAREQLIAACDAASLAGAATLASQDNVDPVAAHDQAMNTALTAFQQNSVLGARLSDAQLGLTDIALPGAGQSSVNVEFLDPHNNNQPVDLGDPAGKIVRVSAVLGLEPAFGRFLGLGTVPVRAISSGGVPDLDVVLAFDISGSIDDQTPVTFVRRQWSPAQARIVYIVPPARPGAKAGPLAQGRIYDVLGPVPTGTRVNATFPQYLANSNTPDIRWPLTFSEKSGSPGASPGLRGASNSGAPPGNQSTGNPLSAPQYVYTYTDLVVNIDGKETFQGISVDGYDFPDLATVVEAARGNLENGGVFRASRADSGVPPNVLPKAGYQAKYFELARANVHPLGDAQKAASDFFTIMNTNTDGHFGLVAFSDNGGTSP
ncbi:MAG TPA: pilus assembly protein TadG-related protein, partial [Candidatus Obscuribacterales bacterium]